MNECDNCKCDSMTLILIDEQFICLDCAHAKAEQEECQQLEQA